MGMRSNDEDVYVTHAIELVENGRCRGCGHEMHTAYRRQGRLFWHAPPGFFDDKKNVIKCNDPDFVILDEQRKMGK